MEVTKTEEVVDAVPVKVLTEKEKAIEIEKAQIADRNRSAEEKSRVDGFIPELNALQKKWNVSLVAKVEFTGVGTNISQRLDVLVSANRATQESLSTVSE